MKAALHFKVPSVEGRQSSQGEICRFELVRPSPNSVTPSFRFRRLRVPRFSAVIAQWRARTGGDRRGREGIISNKVRRRGRTRVKESPSQSPRPPGRQTDRQTGRRAKGITSLPPFPPSVFLPSSSLRRLFVRPSRERPNKSESASLPSSSHELGLPLYAFPFPRRRLVGLDPSARVHPPRPSVRVHNPQSALINGSEIVTPVRRWIASAEDAR